MAAKIIKVCREEQPSYRFIGKRYTDADRGNDGGFGHKWSEWFENGWFNKLDELREDAFTDGDYIGLMGCSEEQNSFEYWIGMFLPAETMVPEGYKSVEIPAGDVGLCWIYGSANNGEIFGEGMHNLCVSRLKQNDLGNCRDNFKGDDQKWWWFFERYNCPRFTTPDASGNVILDYGIYID